MKALVVSGGGAHGAYAGGIIENLIKKQSKSWDIYLGTSTGSLLTPLISINKIDQVKEAYLSVTQDDIFSFCPFKIKGNKKGKLKFIPTVWRILKGDDSVGDSSALEKTIMKNLSKKDFDLINESKKIVGCCVSNLTTGKKEYKFTNNNTYEDYVEWIHASSAVPPIMSIVKKNDCSYADGGIVEKTPIQQAIDLGATEIDAIILSREKPSFAHKNLSNVLKVVDRIISMMLFEISSNDIKIGKVFSREKDVILNLYYPDPYPVGNAMVFHPPTMEKNWDLGYKMLNKRSKSKQLAKKFIIPAHSSNVQAII